MAYMQIAAITDEISQDFEHALDVLLEYGATGAELRGLWGTNIADLTDEQAARAKAALDQRSMHVVALSTPFFKCDLESDVAAPRADAGPLHLARPRSLEQQMDMLRRCCELAHLFDTKLIRVFSFWNKEALTPQIEARIVAAFKEPLRIAESEDVILGLENEHACFLGTGAQAARVAQAINSPRFKIVWDPGNAYAAGEHPFPEGYEAARPWVAHVHVKDGRTVQEDGAPQPQFCIVGDGEIDYAGQFAALIRDGYQGAISVETHHTPPTGTGPDGKGTGEDGTRLDLAALRILLNQ